MPANARYKHSLLLKVAVVAQGARCQQVMHSLEQSASEVVRLRLTHLVTTGESPRCREMAAEKGIEILTSPSLLAADRNLDMILEMTGDPEVLTELARCKPPATALLDHRAAELLLSLLHWDGGQPHQLSDIGLATSFASAMLEASPDAVMVIDRNYRIIQCKNVEKITMGKGTANIVGRYCFEAIHGDTRPCTDPDRPCALAEAAKTGRPARAVHNIKMPDGTTRISQVTTYPLVNHFGEIVQFVDVVRDITQDVSAHVEARARAIRDDLQRFIQEDRLVTLGRLVASVCHEINNPISSIATFNKLMLTHIRENSLPPEGLAAFERYLDLSVREALRCGKIVNNLLTFARQKGVASKQFDLVELVQTILMLLGHAMTKTGVTARLDLPPAPFSIYGDYAQIQQCLMNLISNAVEAMPEGGTLTIGAHRQPSSGEVWIEVADTGTGIAEHHLQRIFEPFFSTKTDGKGVGLGLSMVYGIVREHGGNVSVHSAVGRGTTFRVILPGAPASTASTKGDPQ
ncbi:MAG: ATP-binding protein [Desulfobacterales bacterium]|nr:ATP-binding protein [Desulfobacteraceae bacterium]MDY0311940.1 ATP-binding protein [Desulfobacterales bacterium]